MTWKRILLPALLGALLLAFLIPEFGREEPPDGPVAPPAGDLGLRNLSDPPTGPPAGDCVIRVRERDGRPGRAAVFATGLANRPPERADYLGETGADGRLARSDFRIEPRGSVFAVALGRTAPPVPFTPCGAELTLGDGIVVTGTVRDEEGKPLPGVLVAAGRPYHNPSLTSTDQAGRFRLTGLLPGRFNVEGRLERYTSSGVEIETTAWDETCEVELDDFPAAGDSVLVDVRFSSPPEADPQLITRDGKKKRTHWLPRADSLVRIESREGREVEVVCPGFRSAKARVPAAEAAIRLDLEAGPGMPLSILVVDPAGRPVPGALILLTRNADDHYPKAPRTGPDGRLALGAHHRGLYAVASAFAGASERMRIVEGRDEIVLPLRPAAVLTGRVLDRDTGEPVAGTGVSLQGGDCACCSPWTTETDGSGEYRFAGIPAGQFVKPYATGGRGVTGTRRDMPASHAEALARRLGHLVEGEETVRFADLLVTRYPTVVHRFRLDPAIPGEPVKIESVPGEGSFSRRVEEDGTVSIEARTGSRLFLVSSGGLMGVAKPGKGEDAVPVRLEPPARVIAELDFPEDGPPIFQSDRWVDVNVYLRTEGEAEPVRWGGASADGAGRADLTGDLLAVGPAEIENVVSLTSGQIEFENGPIRISAADLADRLREGGGEYVLRVAVRRVDPNRLIPVLVVDAGGRPVAGVRIGDPDDPQDVATTDDEGRAEIRRPWRPLPPHTGDWNLPEGAADEPIRLEVERARRVRLRIVGPRGEPVAGEWVRDAEWSLYEETDGSGRLDLLVPTRFDPLVLRAERFWLGAVDLSLETEEIEVRAVPRRRLDVTIRGPKELAVERKIEVRWQVDSPPGTESAGTERADQKGEVWRARLALPPFSGRLRAVSSNLRYGARADAPPEASKVELTLTRLPEHEVILVLLDAEGRPLADREVRCDDRFFTTGALVPRRARTDEAGRLCLKLPEGDHRLTDIEVGDLAIHEVDFPSPAPQNLEIRLRPR